MLLSPQTLDLRITQWNKAAEKLYGWKEIEVLGKLLDDVCRTEFVSQTQAQAQSELLSKKTWSGELRQQSRDQRELRVRAFVSLLEDSQGNVIGEVTLNQDITEQKKMEDQLRQAQKMKALGTLAGGIAHDFNNLLVPILGLSEIIKTQLPQESPHVKHLEMISESARRAKDLVSQILTVGRKAKTNPQPLLLKEVVEETLKLLRATLPTSITFQEEMEADFSQVNADPSQLHQVIMNLCINGSQAMPEGGILTIGLKSLDSYPFINDRGEKKEGPCVCLKVGDTGAGIDEETLEHIFEPFFTTKELGSEKGTGLGLAMVSGIVEQHGGQIEVQSEKGKGTSIFVYFPVSKPPKKITPIKEAISLENKGECILLVEDEAIVLETGKTLLGEIGYEISGFQDSEKALQAFETHPKGFDLVITDYMMPKLNGEQLAEKLKAIRPDLPVILCTGYADLPTKETLEKWKLDGAVIKPYDLEKMNQTIQEVLRNVKT